MQGKLVYQAKKEAVSALYACRNRQCSNCFNYVTKDLKYYCRHGLFSFEYQPSKGELNKMDLGDECPHFESASSGNTNYVQKRQLRDHAYKMLRKLFIEQKVSNPEEVAQLVVEAGFRVEV